VRPNNFDPLQSDRVSRGRLGKRDSVIWMVLVGGGVSEVVGTGDQPLKRGLFAYQNAVSGNANLYLFRRQAGPVLTGGARLSRKDRGL
jgi:hypothetical protein